MTITTDADAIAAAQGAAQTLGEVAAYWHTMHPTFAAARLHLEASDMGTRLEELMSAPAGSVSLKPNDGTPK